MRKTKEKYEADIVQVIKDNKIMFIQHIFGVYTAIGSSQFYKLGLHQSEAINTAIQRNRMQGCNYMVNKWIGSENPTLQVAAYRLICTEDERRNLNQSYIDHTTKGSPLQQPITPEQGRQFMKELEESL